jgi:GTP pyrophosphokinase
MAISKYIEKLSDKYSQVDKELLQRALDVAEKAHKGQKRASGEPYINHCKAVASILAEMHVPPSVVAAGLLHDTVEDTGIDFKDLKREFGKEIFDLVQAVTKLGSLPRVSKHSESKQSSSGEKKR